MHSAFHRVIDTSGSCADRNVLRTWKQLAANRRVVAVHSGLPCSRVTPFLTMSDDLLESASDLAFNKLKEVGGDPRNLPTPLQTVAVVIAAHGVLENGGLRHFFENDWPGNPPYNMFASAYERIGAGDFASAIRAFEGMFPMPTPEQYDEGRCAFMDEDYATSELSTLDKQCTSDVWAQLASYVEMHRESFSFPHN